MGGKSSTSTSSVSIPPEVLARYNAVNARAETAAAQPFQNYTGQFVAGLTPEQQAGVGQTAAASQTAQPYYQAAAGMTLGAGQNVGPLTSGQISQYMNPFTQAVVTPTMEALKQQQGQQLAEQQGQAIKGGAFGGDRAGLQRAQLQGQQNLGLAQAIAPIYQQGYGQAVQTAAGQQNVAAQDLARQMQSAQQLAGLGTGAQAAGLQGAQALIGAGTLGQQTQQADLTANYQQFLQQRGYDFQTAQFLANIAMGTGALSGSTTSTTQPAPFFSDARLKHDAKKIGETNDGLPIYSFKYNGSDQTQIGLMAQDVEKKKPEAVGLAPAADGHMYKTVDYDKATRARKYAGGGLVGANYDPSSMGGAVTPDMMGQGFAGGGLVDATDLAAILASQQKSFNPHGQGNMGVGTPGATGIVPAASLPTPKLVVAAQMPKQPPSGLAQTMGAVGDLGKAWDTGSSALDMGKKGFGMAKDLLNNQVASPDELKQGQADYEAAGSPQPPRRPGDFAGGGLVVPRHGYALDGSVDNDGNDDEKSGIVIPGQKGGIPLSAGLKAAELAVAKPAGGGQQGGLGSTIKDAAGLISGVKTIGEGASSLMSFFPAMFAANGGLVPRDGYATRGGTPTNGISGTGLGDVDMAALQDIADAPPTVPTGLVATTNETTASDKGPDYRSMAVNAANKAGIDPDHFVRLAQGESSFNPRPGDEGSSGGVLQLHVKGASERYPHAGVGDDYFITRRPDLNDKLSPADKVKFLSAPENQEDVLAHGADYIKRNGAGAWTVARQQNLFGAGEGRASSPSAPSAPSAPTGLNASLMKYLPTTKDAKTGEEGVNWKQVLVPLATGLAGMAASPSRYLGAAALQGLGAGAQAYTNLEKQQADVDSTRVATAAAAINAARSSFDPVNKVVWGKDGTPMLMMDYIKLTPAQKAAFGYAGGALAQPMVDKAISSYMSSTAPKASTTDNKPNPLAVPTPDETLASHPLVGKSTLSHAANEAPKIFDPSSASASTAAAESATYAKQASAGASIARENAPNISSLVTNVAKRLQGTGWEEGGTAFVARNELTKALGTVASAVTGKTVSNIPEAQDLIEKTNTLSAGNMAKSVGQESAQALEAYRNANPTGNMTREAQADLTAQLAMLAKKAQDKGDHKNVYGQLAKTQGFTEADQAFNEDHAHKYLPEKNLFKQAILNYPTQLEKMYNGEATPEHIDEFFKLLAKQKGIPYAPDMRSYFRRGGQ